MKIKFGSLVCEVEVAENCKISSEVMCKYEDDTIAYAVKRFLSRNKRISMECTNISWQKRLAKGKEKRKQKFEYLVPAVFVELPGGWIRISGDVDAIGVLVNKVEILKEHPYIS